MRVSYLVHDEGGTIWCIGQCDHRFVSEGSAKGLTTVKIAITTKGKIHSLGGSNLFASYKDENDFELVAKDKINIYKKKDIELTISKRNFIAGKESITVSHNAPTSIRIWRDYHTPIHNPDHPLGRIPPNGTNFTASVPGYYSLMVRHPRYKAKSVSVYAMVPNE